MRPSLVAALGLLFFISTSMAMPSLAQVPSTPQSRIAQLERILFGEARTGKPFAERLNAIEEFVFGKTGKGAVASRLDAVEKVIAPNSAQRLMPPIAPVRDQFSTQRDAAPAADPMPAFRRESFGQG